MVFAHHEYQTLRSSGQRESEAGRRHRVQTERERERDGKGGVEGSEFSEGSPTWPSQTGHHTAGARGWGRRQEAPARPSGPSTPHRLSSCRTGLRVRAAEAGGGRRGQAQRAPSLGCCHFTAHRSHHRRRIHKMQTKKNNLLMLINPPITRPGGPW